MNGEAVRRILEVAPLFDIQVSPLDAYHDRIVVLDEGKSRTDIVHHSRIHLRVLAELCEKLLPWVYFHEGEHCAQSLLKQLDLRLPRLIQLYRQRSEDMLP